MKALNWEKNLYEKKTLNHQKNMGHKLSGNNVLIEVFCW